MGNDSPPPLEGGGWGEGFAPQELRCGTGTNPSPHPLPQGEGENFMSPPPLEPRRLCGILPRITEHPAWEGRQAMDSNTAPVEFLSGIRIVDFTQFEAGPSCTEALAWLGADVVKIENPKLGDPGRRRQPGKPDDDPWYFYIFNANKKSMTVNLKSPRGLALVRDLLRKADVCVENFAPGTIERLGLGYEDVKKLNPGIIYCQVKGFGEGSPFETNLAFDMIAQACGGTMSVTGEAGRMPVKPGISVGDTGTGMLMAITILGALYQRRETGQGRRLQVAMQTRCCTTCARTSRRSGAPERRWGAPAARCRASPTRHPACIRASRVGRTTGSM